MTKIVGIANSPYYTGLDPSASVQDAIVRIGTVETRNILMAIMLRSRVFPVAGMEELTRGMWQQALAASVTTRALAARLGMEPEQAFLAGLVHDVGRMVILHTAGEIQRRSRGRFCPDPLALERVIEELHPLLGGVVAESWHLGGSLALAISHHHDPAGAPESVRLLAAVIEVAAELGRSIANGSAVGLQGNLVAAARLEQFGLADAVAREIVAEAYEGFRELFKIL